MVSENISDRSRTGCRTTLPIGSRPAIDLIVDECRAAGVNQIAVVVRAGSSQVQDYYAPNPVLESLLARHSWQLKGEIEVGGSGLVARTSDGAEAGRYGVLDVARRDERLLLTGVREEMPSGPTRDSLTNISRYVLAPTVIDLVRELPVDPRSGERRITDALLRLVDSEAPPLVYVTDGQYFDVGDHRGLLAANNFLDRGGLLDLS
jgi:UTP-glucose-1-phosphate uridylyltransferase